MTIHDTKAHAHKETSDSMKIKRISQDGRGESSEWWWWLHAAEERGRYKNPSADLIPNLEISCGPCCGLCAHGLDIERTFETLHLDIHAFGEFGLLYSSYVSLID